MIITVSELKNNLEKYIDLAQAEDIYITKNGEQKYKLTNVASRPLAVLDGMLENFDLSDQEIKDLKFKRLNNI